MTSILFNGDDRGYLEWLELNPGGYAVNFRRRFDPTYVVLHRANCAHMKMYPKMDANPGGFTEKSYLKVCGNEIGGIENLLRLRFGYLSGISKKCGICKPI